MGTIEPADAGRSPSRFHVDAFLGVAMALSIIVWRVRHFGVELLITFALFVGILVIYEGTRFVFVSWRKMAVEEVAIFFGGPILSLPFSHLRFRINFVPFGSYTRFSFCDLSEGRRGWLSLARWERAVMELLPLMAMAMCAVLFLGPHRTVTAALSCITEGSARAAHPKILAAPIVRDFFQTAANHPATAFGLIAVFIFVTNLIFNLPSICLTFLYAPAHSDEKNRAPGWLRAIYPVLMITFLATATAWAVAVFDVVLI